MKNRQLANDKKIYFIAKESSFRIVRVFVAD